MRSTTRWCGLVLGTGLLCFRPSYGAAQIEGCPSYIAITAYPSSPSPFNQKTGNITVEYGEDQTEFCLSMNNSFNTSTFKFKVNGVDRTSYFSVGAWQAVGTNVPLVDDQNNALYAEIEGWDEDDNPVTNTDTKNVTADWTPVPTISLGPYEYQVHDLSRCAASCFQLVQVFSTVPYFTMDQPQAVTLVYHGDRANPRPVLQVDVTRPTGQAGAPAKYRFQAQVKVGGNWVTQTFTNGEQTIQYDTTLSTTVRLKGQLADTSRVTGVYDLKIITGLWYGSPDNKWQDATVETKLVWVNEKGSPIARGWTLGGEQRLYEQSDGSALITDGWGNAVYYPKTAGTFTTPIGDFAKLSFGCGGPVCQFVRAYPDSTKIIFDSFGRMKSIQDRFLNTWGFSRNFAGRLETIKDPLSTPTNPRDIEFFYGSNGLDSIVDLGGRKTTVTVDGNRLLTRIKDPNADTTKYTYATASYGYRMTAVRDRRGFTTDFYYGPSWKLDSILAPSVTIYGGANVRPRLGFIPWQPVGMATGPTSSTPWTPAKGDTIRAVAKDPQDHWIKFTVNKWGQPLVSTHPMGSDSVHDTTTVTRNAAGLPIRVTHTLDATAKDTAAYNGDGLPTYLRPAGQPATTITYGAWAQPTQLATTGQPTVTSYLGTNGRVDSLRAGAHWERYTYDARGRLLTVKDRNDTLLLTRSYNGTNGNRVNDLVRGREPMNYGHDGYGRIAWVGPESTIGGQWSYYDVMNRPDSIRDRLGHRTRFFYNAASRVDSVMDPLGQVYRFAYSAVGWLTSRTDPTGASEQYRYDRDGRLREWVNRRTQTTSYEYDALHRLTRKWGAATDTVITTYRDADRTLIARRAGRDGTVITDSLVLDVARRPVRAATNWGQATQYTLKLHYQYTSGGLLDSLWATGLANFMGRKYEYNTTAGTLSTLRIGGRSATYNLDVNFRPVETQYAGGDREIRAFAPTNGLTEMVPDYNPLRTLARRASYDSLGRVVAQFGDSAYDQYGRTFGYDSVGRVAQDTAALMRWADCTYQEDLGWECPDVMADSIRSVLYDAVGNVVRDSVFRPRYDSTITVLTGSYGTGNRIQAFAGCTYQTDADGNVTSRTCDGTTTTFWWSSENRLDSLSASGVKTRYVYDGMGRLAKVNTVHLVWDEDHLYAEISDANVKLVEYSYLGMDQAHAVATGDTVYFAHRDAVGNVIGLVDQGATQRAGYGYTIRGELTGGSFETLQGGAVNRARFKGALWMGDLYYVRARWYEPRTGRFMSEDPAGLAGGINPYVYAGNDAVNAADPTGRELVTVCEIEGYHLYERDAGGTWHYVHTVVENIRCWDEERGGGGGGGSAAAPDVGDEAERKCQIEAFVGGVTVAADVLGITAVVKASVLATRFALRSLRLARETDIALRAAGRYVLNQERPWVAGAIGGAVEGYMTGEAVQLTAAIGAGTWPRGELFWDLAALVPGASTIGAVRSVNNACLHPNGY